MHYVKGLVYSFFLVFFVDYLVPGVDVVNQTKLPHIGGDLMFALGLGFLNSLIVPILRIGDGYLTGMRIAIVALVLNFAAYAILKLLPIGVFVTSVEGYFLAACLVSLGASIIGYVQMKHLHKKGTSGNVPPSDS